MTSPLSAVLYGVCGLLGIFWLLITVLCLAYNIQGITNYESDGLYEAVTKVKFVFDLLYLFLVTAILLRGIGLIASSKGGNDAQQKVCINHPHYLDMSDIASEADHDDCCHWGSSFHTPNVDYRS